MDDTALVHFRPSEQLFVKRMRDAAGRVDFGHTYLSDFLTPREVFIASVIAAGEGVLCQAFGGYDAAERKRVIYRDVADAAESSAEEFCVTCLLAEWKRGSEPPGHADYLGALMGLGLRREKLGDIVLCAEGAHVFCEQAVTPLLLQQWQQVGRVRIELNVVLQVSPTALLQPVMAERSFTVSSLRLDAVVSHAFGLSRTKTFDPIKSGRVQLNFSACTDPAEEVREGDMISLRGAGRARVLDVGGNSRSGRIFVKIGRYI